jgi:hypothetical protein
MFGKLFDRILSEPEAVTALTAVATAQAACPGICVQCAAPAGGAVAGSIALRVLRRWKGRKTA